VKPDFTNDASILKEKVISWRRDFHQYPELGFQEHRTARIIAETLKATGYQVRTRVAETGVVGLLKGNHPGPTVLLRFDMDALPIQELNEIPYASANAGVMHACGHDGHMAIGLAVAHILYAHKSEMHGHLELVFQPGEEGLGGALRMIEEGILKDTSPDYCLALHLWNEKPEGWLGIGSGPIMAGADILKINIRGTGGHGAAPQHARDPVLACAQVVTALQSIVSRCIDPLKSAVLSVTQIRAGEAFNVIPEHAHMHGTIRTFEPEVRRIILERVDAIAKHIALASGCEAEVRIDRLTPPVVNDPQLTALAQAVAQEQFPGMHCSTGERSMVSEDMAYFMEAVPGCFILVGSASPQEGLNAPHHSPYFNIHEGALVCGAALLSAIAWRLMEMV
jgi:amidohydrolase